MSSKNDIFSDRWSPKIANDSNERINFRDAAFRKAGAT